MRCVAFKFVSMVLESRRGHSLVDTNKFLRWAAAMGPSVGLQAFRMITELVHKNLASRLLSGPVDSSSSAEDSSSRGSHSNDENRNSGYRHGSRDYDYGEISAKRSTGYSLDTPSFVWRFVPGGGGIDTRKIQEQKLQSGSSEYLNSMVVCTSSDMAAVELSVHLTSLLRELLSSAFDDGTEMFGGGVVSQGPCQCPLQVSLWIVSLIILPLPAACPQLIVVPQKQSLTFPFPICSTRQS